MKRILPALLCLAVLAGCDARSKKAQVGPLKDWIVGTWIRNDDHLDWNFNSGGEVMTGGRSPIGGSYAVEEPNKVEVHISGANALTASMQLGLKADANQNLYIHFVVDGDEMHVTDVASTVLFIKK
jgi:hypothetical protein